MNPPPDSQCPDATQRGFPALIISTAKRTPFISEVP